MNTSHPEDLLEAYALDLLEAPEWLSVEAHLESCDQCQGTVAGYQQAAERLCRALSPQAPPPALRARLRNALPDHAPVPPVPTLPAGAVLPLAVATSAALTSRMSRLLLPVAAVIMIGLFSSTLMLHRQVSSRVDQLEQENSTVMARLNQTVVEETKLTNSINQIRATNYLMANPRTQPLLLESPDGSQGAQGVLLVSDGGRRAILMVADMKRSDPHSVYQVWLVRPGQRLLLGEVIVDAAGWGTTTLTPPESLFQFEWVNLTEENQPSPAAPSGPMILRSKIPTTGSR